ncbi:MAG TPA: hydroxymethylbilane synthase, partial [Saprospiraceae bacterium]|nr:hydroxymethylbilane synthase [Saprospiraceae bacterium]
MNNNYLRIGTRSSDLAIWQANHLAQQLHCKGIDTKLILADDNADNALIGKFSDEVEQLLLSNKVDIAVHSLKDLDTKPKEGLVIAGLSSRANPSDLLIIHPEFYDESQLFKIKNTTVIGTSAERRKYQILLFRPDLIVQNIRGNITERIALLRESKIGAIILAKAGIDRLDMDLVDLKTIILHPREFTPAAGQGILAYQVKTENIYVRKLLMQIHNYDVAQCSNVERKI